MTIFNIWGPKVNWYQLIHRLWDSQNRFVRDVLCFKYVTWAPGGNTEDIKPNWRATLGSRFFKIGGKSRKSVRAVYRAPELILNMSCSGQKLLRTTTKNHSQPPKSFRTLGVGESFLYARQTILNDQLSYYRCIYIWFWPGSSESQVRGRISPPKFFSHDSNFLEDFSTEFQDSKSNLKFFSFWHTFALVGKNRDFQPWSKYSKHWTILLMSGFFKRLRDVLSEYVR